MEEYLHMLIRVAYWTGLTVGLLAGFASGMLVSEWRSARKNGVHGVGPDERFQ